MIGEFKTRAGSIAIVFDFNLNHIYGGYIGPEDKLYPCRWNVDGSFLNTGEETSLDLIIPKQNTAIIN